jgi:hypothetical protein
MSRSDERGRWLADYGRATLSMKPAKPRSGERGRVAFTDYPDFSGEVRE